MVWYLLSLILVLEFPCVACVLNLSQRGAKSVSVFVHTRAAAINLSSKHFITAVVS